MPDRPVPGSPLPRPGSPVPDRAAQATQTAPPARGNRWRRLVASAPLWLLLAVWSPPLPAQGRPQLDREIVFVRGLARELGLVTLAEGELGRLEQAYRSAADQDRLLQLRIEVSLVGARIKPSRIEQRTDYEKALEQSKELLARSRDEAVQRDTRAALAEAAQEFGQFLVEELEIARSESPDRVAELETEARQVFVLGIEACDAILAALAPDRDASAERKLEYGLTWMRKGVLQREHGRAVAADRSVHAARAIAELEKMVLEYGEETALGLRGLFEIAQAREVAGDIRDAIDSYRTTIDQIATALGDDSSGLGRDTRAFLFDMMQEVYAHLGEVLFEQGDAEGAESLFRSFRDHLARFGEQGRPPLEACHPRYGHLSFLTECRFLAESGDAAKVQQALATAQRIHGGHQGDFVGIQARAVLADILRDQPNLVSGALLFEVAKGEYQDRNFEAAMPGLRQALAAMTPAEQKALGLEAWDLLGRCFLATDRCLEAVLAFGHGLRSFGTQDGSAAPGAGDVADRLDRAVTRLRTITGNDAALQPLFADQEPLVLAFATGGAGKVHWQHANDLFRDAKYAAAAAAYEQVPIDFLHYELARARIVQSHRAAGAFAEARQAIAAYRTWRQSPAAALDPANAERARMRATSAREIDFAEASIAFAEAHGDRALGIRGDPAKYPVAIELMQAFVANHGQSKDDSVLRAIDALARMHAEMGDLAKAEAAYVQIRASDELRASRLASVLFKSYLDHTENLQRELDAAVASGQDPGALRAELQATRQRLCSLGLDYMRSSAKPQLGILANTMAAFERLGDWKQVDFVAQKALQLYGDATDAETKRVIDLTIRPKVGEALLEQGRFQQALDMLTAAEQANPNQYEVKRLICRALGGWFYIDKTGRGAKQPALGRYQEAYDKYNSEYRTWALRPGVRQYSYEYYRFQWESYWFAKQAGTKDDIYKGYAESILRVTGALDNFAALKALGEKGTLLFTYFDLNR